MNNALYIDMSKGFEYRGPKGDRRVGGVAPGRSSSDYDYVGGATPPKDGRSWEATGGASGGWKALKGTKGAAKPKGQEAAEPKGPPTLEEKQIPKDPNKDLAPPPGKPKQSILSGKREDFKDHSVADHYHIMHDVEHDPKLSQMHKDMVTEKTKGMSSTDHDNLSVQLLAEGHRLPLSGSKSKHLKAAADYHEKKSESIRADDKSEFSDHSVSDHYKIMNKVAHDPEQWKMHYDMAHEKSKNMTAAEHQQVSDDMYAAHRQQGNNAAFGAAAEMHANSAASAKQASEKTKGDISAKTGQKDLERQVSSAKLSDKKETLTIDEGKPGEYTTDTHATHEEASAAHKQEKEKLKSDFEATKQKHNDMSEKAKYGATEKAPKAADFKDGKVPPKIKQEYEERKANAEYMKEITKQLAEEARVSNKEKKDAHTAKSPKAADWKAKEKEGQQAEKDAAQAEADKPQPPTSDLERAEVSGHTSTASTLLENINSHLDSNSLSDEDTQHLTSIRDALDEHQNLTTIPSKKQKTDLKLATALAGEHGKKPFEEAGEAAPAKTQGTGNLMGAFRSGRAAGEQVGEAAGSQEGGGAIGSAAITYAATGAVGAGHFLLNKDDKFAKDKYIPPTKSPKLPQEAKA